MVVVSQEKFTDLGIINLGMEAEDISGPGGQGGIQVGVTAPFFGLFALALLGWTAKENAMVLPLLWLGYEALFVPAENRLLLGVYLGLSRWPMAERPPL